MVNQDPTVSSRFSTETIDPRVEERRLGRWTVKNPGRQTSIRGSENQVESPEDPADRANKPRYPSGLPGAVEPLWPGFPNPGSQPTSISR